MSWGRWVECGGMWGRCRSSELGKVGRVWNVRRWRLQSELGKVGGVWGSVGEVHSELGKVGTSNNHLAKQLNHTRLHIA